MKGLEFLIESLLFNPLTGEKPISGWIVAIAVIAAALVIISLLLPLAPKVKAFIKDKFLKK